eukprot:scaffold96999_cov37-Tisochrysis_lutea.AAC.2
MEPPLASTVRKEASPGGMLGGDLGGGAGIAISVYHVITGGEMSVMELPGTSSKKCCAADCEEPTPAATASTIPVTLKTLGAPRCDHSASSDGMDMMSAMVAFVSVSARTKDSGIARDSARATRIWFVKPSPIPLPCGALKLNSTRTHGLVMKRKGGLEGGACDCVETGGSSGCMQESDVI